MGMVQFLVHRETKREFQVVRVDKEKGEITLKGPNTEFTEPFDKERFKANGYDLVNREEGSRPAPAKLKAAPAPAPEPEEDPEDDDSGDD